MSLNLTMPLRATNMDIVLIRLIHLKSPNKMTTIIDSEVIAISVETGRITEQIH
jgi:hypothetical protein